MKVVIPLLVKSNLVALPNNRPLVLKRLLQLKRRFGSNPKFKQDYIVLMQEMIENFVEKDPENEPCSEKCH